MTRYHVIGAAICGPDHVREGLPCQDAWAFGPSGSDGAAFAVADGAGSAAHPDVGATTATAALVAALCDRGEGESLDAALLRAVGAARSALVREAALREVPLDALACTLLAVLVAGDRAAVAHVGDGAIVGQRAGSGEIVLVSAPDRGEYANETWFLTSPSFEGRLRVTTHEGLVAVAAITDGCQRAALEDGKTAAPFMPFWGPLFAYAAEAQDAESANAEVTKLLEGEALSRSSGDDKTLVILRSALP